jgi:hypothetical protein
MAKLPFEFCPVAFKIRTALEEQRRPDAKALAIEYGQKGYHSEEFSKVMAELLVLSEPQPGMAGQPQLKFPRYWLEIESRWWRLKERGFNVEAAAERLAELAKRIGCKKLRAKTIQNTINFINKSYAEHSPYTAVDEHGRRMRVIFHNPHPITGKRRNK